ncbi:MAG: hypothetical protein GF308_13735 [Candidatus Heimdallarchaeota archaeon]|nr:hypothetical protein [Candidatus Heimdallarchaeota archaeon]
MFNEKSFPLQSIDNRDDLFYPNLDLNISKIKPTALSLLDKKFSEKRMLTRHLKNKEGWKKLQEKSIENILVLILDALGLQEFMRYSQKIKAIANSNCLPLCSVFPTITSSCLATIHLGEMPINHGILGQKIHFREIGNIVDTLSLLALNSNGHSLTSAGVNVKNWLWCDFPLGEESEIMHVQLIEDYLVNKGLSKFIHEKDCAIGYASHVDCFAAAKRILEKEDKKQKKKLLDIYVGSTDAISHRYTPNSKELSWEVENIEKIFLQMLARLDPTVAEKTAVFIVADHGQEPLLDEKKITVSRDEQSEDLDSLLAARGRSGRVIHLFSKEGKREELVSWFEEKLGNAGIVLTPEAYPKLLGRKANNKQVIERLGDVQIILGRNASLFFGHSGNFDPIFNLGLNATHGSLSRNELIVPFVFSTVDDLII